MTAGFKPCPWLIPEDMPRERLQPHAGRIYLMELGGVEPPAAPGPAPVRQHQASPANIKGQRIEDFAVFNPLAFVFRRQYGYSMQYCMACQEQYAILH